MVMILYIYVTDCGRPVRLPQFAWLSPTEPIRGRYQSGRRWHIPVAAVITDARAGTGLVPVSAEATTTSEREGRSSSLILPNSASLDDASVCSPMELIIRLLSEGLAALSLVIGIYLPHESG